MVALEIRLHRLAFALRPNQRQRRGRRFGKRTCCDEQYQTCCIGRSWRHGIQPTRFRVALNQRDADIPTGGCSGLYQPLADYSPVVRRKPLSNARPTSLATNHLFMDLLLSKSSSRLKVADTFYDMPTSASDETNAHPKARSSITYFQNCAVSFSN